MQFYEIPYRPGADMAGPFTDTLHAMAANGGGMLWLPVGNIVCNSGIPLPDDMHGISVLGMGRGATQADFFNSKTGGFIASGKKRTYHNFFRDFSVRGPGSGIGMDLPNWDSGALERMRIYNWGTCVSIRSDAGLGALRNRIIDCIITNGADHALRLWGDQGAHETYIECGQLSSSGIGLRVDAPTDKTTVWQVQMEANKDATMIAGNRGLYSPRFEGSAGHDANFVPGAYDNFLLTAFFNTSKHADTSGVDTNNVFAYGRVGAAGQSIPTDLLAQLAAIRGQQDTQIQARIAELAAQQLLQMQALQQAQAQAMSPYQEQIQQMQADWLNQQQQQAQAMHDLNADVAGLLLRLQKLEAAEMAGIAAYRGETLGTSTP